MHGLNPIRVQDLTKPRALQMEGVPFLTIQGEGPFAGIPAVFIRLSGCWLKCHFCDTQFESGINTSFHPDEVLDRVRAAHGLHPCRLVVLTGGDPLRQNITLLCKTLTDANYHVQIETAGLRWVPGLEMLCAGGVHLMPAGVSIVISPKTGKVDATVAIHAHSWKYIVDAEDEIDEADGLPCTSTQIPGRTQRLARPPRHVTNDRIYLQPCDREDVEKNRANLDLVGRLAMKYGYRISLQQHKILGVD